MTQFTIEEQKNLAESLLRNIEFALKYAFGEEVEDVMLAGGCPANWALNTPAKDFDIWVYAPNINKVIDTFKFAEVLNSRLDVTLINKSVSKINKENDYEGIDRITAVYGGNWHGMDFDIIFNQNYDPTTTFDCDINKGKYGIVNSEFKLLNEDYLMKYIHHSEITVRRHEADSDARYAKRLRKMYDKFSPFGYKILNHNFSEWVPGLDPDYADFVDDLPFRL